MNAITKRGRSSRSENRHGERAGRRRQIFRLGVALALTLATVASAQTYTVLKSFTGGDGEYPFTDLALAGSTLYGTTHDGGSGFGVVFKVNTDGSGYTTLKSFTGSDGSFPYAGVVLAGSALYGTAYNGGGSNDGVVFKVNTDGTGYTVLKNFTGSDGRWPNAGLALMGSTLYGPTCYGGASDAGLLFKVNTDGSGYTVLKNFRGSDGSYPAASVVLAGSTLYGTTSGGGSSGDGVIFKMNTDGSGYAVLKNFSAYDGESPFAGLVLAGSTFYGTTCYGGSSGCGVVFKINTDGSGYTVLKNFTGSEGQSPQGDLALVGSTLYGTTSHGGSSGDGVIFKMNTDGSGYTVIKNFTGNDGWAPFGGVVLGNLTLYGTTWGAGDMGKGVVFSLAWPSITKPPLTRTAEAGTTVAFSVQVTNTLPELTHYQWFFGGTNALGNATNAFLRLTNVQPTQAGAYTVVVTNLVGAVTSAPALLSVIPAVHRRIVPAVHLPGSTGSLLHLEYADNLAAAPPWSSFTNVTLGNGPEFCFDLSQPLPAQRFYRTWQTNGPQPALDASMATEIPLAGAIGSSVRVDYINAIGPTDAWVTLATVALTNTPQLYFDVTAFRQPTRLYRLVAVP